MLNGGCSYLSSKLECEHGRWCGGALERTQEQRRCLLLVCLRHKG
jgi:hypothetical protein